MKNNYIIKIVRTITSIFPVQQGRRGLCNGCGECCKLPNPCSFLDYDQNNKTICKIYKFRPLNCRKYPRSVKEHITSGKCGFYFEDD